MAMTPKKQLFADEYLIDLNATRAAKRAGYSEKTAYSSGQRLLKDVDVSAYISQRMAEKEAELIANQDEILKYLTAVMRKETLSSVLARTELGAEKVIEKPPDEKEALKAAELLGKRYGLWEKKQDAEAEVPNDGFIDALRGEVAEVWQET